MVKGLGVRVLGLKFPWIRVQRFGMCLSFQRCVGFTALRFGFGALGL